VTYYADETGYHPTITYEDGSPNNNNVQQTSPSNGISDVARKQRHIVIESEEPNSAFYDDLYQQFPSFGLKLQNQQ